MNQTPRGFAETTGSKAASWRKTRRLRSLGQNRSLGRNKGQLHRRQLIQVGGLGILGLGLTDLLQADQPRRPAKSCILILLSGGPSHIDSFDPKPDAPEEIRGPYQPIQTRTPGLLLTERFPRLAKQSHHFCMLRSLSHAVIPHGQAAHMMLSGQPDGSRENNSPFIGSLIARFRPSTANMPSHVWLHNMKTGTNSMPRYDSGLSVIGHAHGALRVGHELDNPTARDFRVRAFDPADGLTGNTLLARSALLSKMQESRTPQAASPASEQFSALRSKAHDLVTSDHARRAFELHHESDKVRNHYGRHPLGQYCLMARRLVEAGVRLVSVTAWPGLAPGETTPTVTQVWDTHGVRYKAGDNMFGNGPFGMRWAFPRLDQAVSALLADLHQRGLLESTLVAVMGEFGRTPRFEVESRGRGHWPHSYSGLLAGGGIQGGTIYGQSDRIGAFVQQGRPVSHADFAATIYHAMGIPPETRYGPDGFSLRLSDGEPVRELFG